MLGIRSERNRPSRLEAWLRAQKARWAVLSRSGALPGNVGWGASLLRLMGKGSRLLPQARSTLISHGGRDASADRQPQPSWPRVCGYPACLLGWWFRGRGEEGGGREKCGEAKG